MTRAHSVTCPSCRKPARKTKATHHLVCFTYPCGKTHYRRNKGW